MRPIEEHRIADLMDFADERRPSAQQCRLAASDRRVDIKGTVSNRARAAVRAPVSMRMLCVRSAVAIATNVPPR